MNNCHKNARTTVFSRELIVKRVRQEGEKVSEVARQFGVSRQTVYKWPGTDRAVPQPYTTPVHGLVQALGACPWSGVATIAAMRRMRKSSVEIAISLSLPISSVTLELRRLGLNRDGRYGRQHGCPQGTCRLSRAAQCRPPPRGDAGLEVG